MKVGETYVWRNALRPDPMTFVVVAKARHRSSNLDRDGSDGYLGLLLDGEHRSDSWTLMKHPGETFTFAKSSAIAYDSKPAV